MIRRSNYLVEQRTPDRLVIRDIGPWDRYATVTNDAEAVVAALSSGGFLPPGCRLYYYDSDGRLDEIVVEHGRFVRFCSVPQS